MITGVPLMLLLTAEFPMMVPIFVDFEHAMKDKIIDKVLDEFPNIPIMLVEVEFVDIGGS